MAEPEPARANAGQQGGIGVITAVELKKHIYDLLIRDTLTHDEHLDYLEKHGKDAAPLLVDFLIRKYSQPAWHDPITHALQEIGKPSADALIHAIGHLELHKEEDVYLLEMMVDTLGRLRDRRSVVPLLLQINRLNKLIKRNHNRTLTDVCVAAKIKIHTVLADLKISAGLDDLLTMLGDGKKRIPDGIVTSLEKIGDKRSLISLVRLYELEKNVSEWSARQVKNVFREIVRRERVTPGDRIFRSLSPTERATLEKFLPSSRGGEHHLPAPALRRATS